jgi:hypothetical protein
MHRMNFDTARDFTEGEPLPKAVVQQFSNPLQPWAVVCASITLSPRA